MDAPLMCVVAALVVCLSGQLASSEDYKPSRTLLIDYHPKPNPTNFLFRGNMPVINGSFAYDAIVSTMQQVAGKYNLSFPGNFTLVDVSYLNIFEEKDLAIERDFFTAHPELGRFHNRVIVGTVLDPPQDDPNLIRDVVKDYIELSVDKLPEVMDYLYDLIQQPGPIVVYSHCEAGTDRTGEVSGAYYMQYLNIAFIDALYIDNHVQGRDMYTTSRNALQWYCFYLKFIKNYPQLNCMV